MKRWLKLYHFLGSIHFAILLIALTALFVAAGTFLEAQSESHLFSASWTYHHPAFNALLWGFFINILISALRRWPFRPKHIPFLITHLGLLMLIGGVILKNYFGIQGSMGLMEGGTSHRIFLPNSYALHVEKKDPAHPGKKTQFDFPLDQMAKQKIEFDTVQIRLVNYAPHSSERKETWIKGNHAILTGLKPIPVTNLENLQSHRIRLHHPHATPWNLLALITDQVKEISQHVYIKGLNIKISDSNTDEILTEIPLVDILNQKIKIKNHLIECVLEWNFSIPDGFEDPALIVNMDDEKMSIALTGPDSLMNKNLTSPYRGRLPLSVDLSREPTLLILQDDHQDDYLFFFNPYGEIHSSLFKNDHLNSLVVYDKGFGGYAIQTSLPFPDFSSSRDDKEQAELLRLAVELRQTLGRDKNPSDLSTPLQLLKQSADALNQDFAETLLFFLQAWENSSQILFSNLYPSKIDAILQKIDWNKMSLHEQYACGWLCLLLEEMEMQMQRGKKFSQILEEREWPFAHQFAQVDKEDTSAMITLFSQQLFAAATQLPRPPQMPQQSPAQALSAYLRALGITLDNIRQPVDSLNTLRTYHAARIFRDRTIKFLSPAEQLSTQNSKHALEEVKHAYLDFQKQSGKNQINHSPTFQEINQALVDYAPINDKPLSIEEKDSLEVSLSAPEVILETPLTLRRKKEIPLQKWEDHRPLVTLEIKKGKRKEYMTLTYDAYGTGLSWPILGGEYTLRYQPLFIELPYKVRLHDARQINYTGTNQPYSYESDIIVTDLKDQSKVEKTISMNNVHETSDGYRFYLASLSPGVKTSPQRVQIIVNYDPVKYLLTYPGALIMSLGIVLLFWLKPYRKT